MFGGKTEKQFEERMAKRVFEQKLIQAQQTSSSINTKRSIPRHIRVKLLQAREKGKILKVAREKQLITYRGSINIINS